MDKTWSLPSRNYEFGVALSDITSLSVFQISVIRTSASWFLPYPCATHAIITYAIFLSRLTQFFFFRQNEFILGDFISLS